MNGWTLMTIYDSKLVWASPGYQGFDTCCGQHLATSLLSCRVLLRSRMKQPLGFETTWGLSCRMKWPQHFWQEKNWAVWHNSLKTDRSILVICWFVLVAKDPNNRTKMDAAVPWLMSTAAVPDLGLPLEWEREWQPAVLSHPQQLGSYKLIMPWKVGKFEGNWRQHDYNLITILQWRDMRSPRTIPAQMEDPGTCTLGCFVVAWRS